MSEIVRVPSAPGSCPDGLSPSVSGHSPCDPSRDAASHALEKATSRSLKANIIGILGVSSENWDYHFRQHVCARLAEAADRIDLLEKALEEKADRIDELLERWLDTEGELVAALSQGIEARSAETRSGLAEGESPSALGGARDQSPKAKAGQQENAA